MTAGRTARSASVRCRFELELEAERVDSGGSARELAGSLLGERAAGQQAPIGCLGRVVAPGDACTAADLLGESADRMQEVHVVAREVVHPLKCSQGWRFQALVAHQTPNDSPVFLLDET